MAVVIAVVLALGLVVPPAQPAHAAAAFVKSLGTAAGLSNAPLSLVTTGAVAPGNSIIVMAGAEGAPAISNLRCSDPVNGNYAIDVIRENGNVIFVYCSVHGAKALPAGTTITVVVTLVSGGFVADFDAVAFEVSGLAVNPLDRTATNEYLLSGTTSITSGSTSGTSQANEFLIGGIYSNTATLTPGTNGTANRCAETGSPTYTLGPKVDNPILGPSTSINSLFCTVSAQAAYQANVTPSVPINYFAALATYRADVVPPVLTNTTSALTYLPGSGPQVIDPALTITDADSAFLSGATVSITTGFTASQDVLTFVNQNGITGSYNAATGVLTLTGNATLAQYQAALRSVTYTNTSASPTGTTRTFSFQVTDTGGNQSGSATQGITPVIATTPINDPNNNGKGDKKDPDERDRSQETETERQQREHTNQSGRSDVSIEGNVLAVEKAADGKSQLVTLGLTRGETQIVQVPCFKDGNCHDIRVGDYLEADGYQNGVGDPNTYFVADIDVEVTRNGKRVK